MHRPATRRVSIYGSLMMRFVHQQEPIATLACIDATCEAAPLNFCQSPLPPTGIRSETWYGTGEGGGMEGRDAFISRPHVIHYGQRSLRGRGCYGTPADRRGFRLDAHAAAAAFMKIYRMEYASTAPAGRTRCSRRFARIR